MVTDNEIYQLWTKEQNILGFSRELIAMATAELQGQIKVLTDEEIASDDLRRRMSDILSRVAVALKGPNPKNGLHSWHDLGEVAEARAKQIDRLLAHCSDGECHTCGEIICPHGEPLHFHHDGCPACYERNEDGHNGN